LAAAKWSQQQVKANWKQQRINPRPKYGTTVRKYDNTKITQLVL